MGLVSSRLAIGQALVTLLAGIQNSSNVNVYTLTQLGTVFETSNNVPWCEVTFLSGQGKPAGSGGNLIGWRIEDETQWLLTSGFGPYEVDPVATHTAMLTAQDIVLPALHTHFQLPQSGNPALPVQSVYSVLPIQVDRSRPVLFPGGHYYLLWSLPIIVKSQYNLGIVSP
jgi:hypothetical protein